jgi:FtsP/CotA-like multicopper oxidase with cupredoxin domain
VVGKKSIRVTRGDTVVLRWNSDTRLELHLHGYDVTVVATPGTPAEMKIVARATGRFPVEIHGQSGSSGGHGHKDLLHLEVYPD